MKIVLLHGIHSKEGDNNMTALAPHLQKFVRDIPVVVHGYGFVGFWEARWSNKGVAEHLSKVVQHDDVLVTHSNGAAIAYLAERDFGMVCKGVLNINPALDRDLTTQCGFAHTIYSESDRAVYLSRFLPFHLWGDQGRVGYKGKMKPADRNTNASSSEWGAMAYQHHCGLFESSRVEFWAEWVAAKIDELVWKENLKWED